MQLYSLDVWDRSRDAWEAWRTARFFASDSDLRSLCSFSLVTMSLW